MKKEQFISYFFVALLVFIVVQVFRIFLPFFQAIFWAAILAFGFYPAYARIRNSLGRHETLSAAISTGILFLIVVPPIVIIFINLTNQAIDLYQAASAYVREGHLEALIERLRSWHVIEGIEHKVVEWEPLKQNATSWVLNTSRNVANFTVGQAGIITKNIVFITLNAILTFFLIFIFLKDGEKIYTFVYQTAPLEDSNKVSIFRIINDTFSAVIRGQILTSITQAIVAGITFALLGIPAPIFFAVATFLISMIPIMGAQAIWLPLTIYLFVTHHTIKGVILAIVGVFGISLIDNIMKPAIIGEKTKLPYFLLFFGILGGMKVYGLIGIFLAPVILSIFFALIKIYQEKFH